MAFRFAFQTQSWFGLKTEIAFGIEQRKVGEVGMSYQSPIEVFQTQMQSQIVGEIYKAVMKVGVNVDKDELLKALQYDRNQYQKGYTDRDSEIVRCKDCKHCDDKSNSPWLNCMRLRMTTTPYWFCADGEVKDNA